MSAAILASTPTPINPAVAPIAVPIAASVGEIRLGLPCGSLSSLRLIASNRRSAFSKDILPSKNKALTRSNFRSKVRRCCSGDSVGFLVRCRGAFLGSVIIITPLCPDRLLVKHTERKQDGKYDHYQSQGESRRRCDSGFHVTPLLTSNSCSFCASPGTLTPGRWLLLAAITSIRRRPTLRLLGVSVLASIFRHWRKQHYSPCRRQPTWAIGAWGQVAKPLRLSASRS